MSRYLINQYERWLISDEEKLEEMYVQGCSLDDMKSVLKRTRFAIYLRLIEIGHDLPIVQYGDCLRLPEERKPIHPEIGTDYKLAELVVEGHLFRIPEPLYFVRDWKDILGTLHRKITLNFDVEARDNVTHYVLRYGPYYNQCVAFFGDILWEHYNIGIEDDGTFIIPRFVPEHGLPVRKLFLTVKENVALFKEFVNENGYLPSIEGSLLEASLARWYMEIEDGLTELSEGEKVRFRSLISFLYRKKLL